MVMGFGNSGYLWFSGMSICFALDFFQFILNQSTWSNTNPSNSDKTNKQIQFSVMFHSHNNKWNQSAIKEYKDKFALKYLYLLS